MLELLGLQVEVSTRGWSAQDARTSAALWSVMVMRELFQCLLLVKMGFAPKDAREAIKETKIGVRIK